MKGKDRKSNSVERTVLDDGTVYESAVSTESVDVKISELFTLPNVVGYANDVGKIKNGENTGEECLTVFVSTKVSANSLKKSEMIPDKISGLQTDVVEVGEMVAHLERTDKLRPFKIGTSVCNVKGTAGTAGPKAIRKSTSKKGFLTNTHVCCETVRKPLSEQELDVVQPGPYDGGRPPRVGKTSVAVIMPEGAPAYNDIGFVEFDDESVFENKTFEHGFTPSGTTTCKVGDFLWKDGRTTKVSIGKVLSRDAVFNVNYGSDGMVQHRNCVVTTAMSSGGDSGSHCFLKKSGGSDTITEEDTLIATYLFAGSQTHTLHHDIEPALSTLGCELDIDVGDDGGDGVIVINVELDPLDGVNTVSCRGTVKDSATKKPIGSCSVVFKPVDEDAPGLKVFSTETDSEGKFSQDGIPSSVDYKIVFSKQGYKTKEVFLEV